jgi:predicted polyphosphate/ATP-dependent NAD kinase
VLKVGLLVNPRAGIGGAVALKGSDGVFEAALAKGGQPRAEARVPRTLNVLGDQSGACEWYCWGGEMGERYLADAGIPAAVLGQPTQPPSAADSRAAVAAMLSREIDLLLFAGGDGTARDILASAGERVVVLGIPCGVKMHSGVFATTPEAAGELLLSLTRGGLVQSVLRDVRDLDESKLRDGRLEPHYFGEMRVPEPGGYLQHTKVSGRESEALVSEEIAADVSERLQQTDRPVILGPGSTLLQIKSALGISGTLLGMDVWQQGRTLATDADRDWLDESLDRPRVVLSFTRSQGFLLGRGNQQLSPQLLARLRREDLWVVGSRTKLATLEGRPLLIDTDDAQLDQRFTGLIEITTGYEDRLLYAVASHA